MKTEISAQDAVERANSAFDKEAEGASERIHAGTKRKSRIPAPLILGAAALAFFVLPKPIRRTVVAAAVPFGANWIRGKVR